MKRLAVLALTAGVGLSAGRAAADWQRPAAPPATALPAPTGMMAPTAPMVPAPQLAEAYPATPTARLRDRFGGGRAVTPEATAAEAAKPGPLARMFQRTPKKYVADPYDPYPAKKAWCETCGPAVRHPLPPLPAGLDLGAYGVRRASADEPAQPAPAQPAGVTVPHAVAGGCAAGACAADAGRPSRSCWECFKGWLCYRQTPNYLPLIPTQRNAPLYTYGTCREGTGYGAGCAGGACGTGHGFAGRAGSGAACTPCPVASESVMPGYRLANPELPGMAPRAAGPVVSPVLPAGHKATAPAPVVPAAGKAAPPAPAVPYKTAAPTPNQRPFIGQ